MSKRNEVVGMESSEIIDVIKDYENGRKIKIHIGDGVYQRITIKSLRDLMIKIGCGYSLKSC